jgi:hypothetical protein
VADELVRIGALSRATKFSELIDMRNDQLADQLKIYKLVLKRTGFTVTQTKREAYVRQAQALIVDEGGVNDLPDGESGLEGVGVQRRVKESSGKEANSGKKRKVSQCAWKGYAWDSKTEFEVVMLAGKRIADGCDYGDGGVRWKKGTVLYKVIWEGYPPTTQQQFSNAKTRNRQDRPPRTDSRATPLTPPPGSHRPTLRTRSSLRTRTRWRMRRTRTRSSRKRTRTRRTLLRVTPAATWPWRRA